MWTSGGPSPHSFLLSSALNSDFCLVCSAGTPALLSGPKMYLGRELGSDRAHSLSFLVLFSVV